MSSYVDSNNRTFKTGADLSAKQYYILKLDSTVNQVVLAAAATDKIEGVQMSKPAAATGSNVDVRLRSHNGTGRVIAGGTIAIGDYLTSDASGKAIATTTAGNHVFGKALQTAASGDIFEYRGTGEMIY